MRTASAGHALPTLSALLVAAAAATGFAPSANAATTSVQYTNWAGYQTKTSAPREVTATWVVPSVSWAGRDTKSSAWVGLGGGNATQGALLQAGTGHDNNCVAVSNRVCTKSVSSYYAFVEVYPQNTLEKVTNLPVKPGDIITADVIYAPTTGRTTMTLTNNTTRVAVQYARQAPAPKAVAEAVVERTANQWGTPSALAKFTPIRFSQFAVRDAWGWHNPAKMANVRMSMVNAGGPLATTSALSASGDSFTETWLRPM